ncbi:MAG: fibrobacter succinogenes major paralogous domain-containing protein, partial [Bacteroidota bacterium]
FDNLMALKKYLMKRLIAVIAASVFTLQSIAQTVTIGTQVWMTKNLDISTFRNGDPIPQAKTDEEWKKAGDNTQPAWCYYENDPANGAKYGKLYNWYAVSDSRGLAPVGYHIPSDDEWTILTDYLGGAEKAGAKMKSKQGWAEDNNGTNSSGFSGLPGGFRSLVGTFGYIGKFGGWWSFAEYSTDSAWYRYLSSNGGDVGRSLDDKGEGFSVRCLWD